MATTPPPDLLGGGNPDPSPTTSVPPPSPMTPGSSGGGGPAAAPSASAAEAASVSPPKSSPSTPSLGRGWGVGAAASSPFGKGGVSTRLASGIGGLGASLGNLGNIGGGGSPTPMGTRGGATDSQEKRRQHKASNAKMDEINNNSKNSSGSGSGGSSRSGLTALTSSFTSLSSSLTAATTSLTPTALGSTVGGALDTIGSSVTSTVGGALDSVATVTQRRYSVPDKAVASQVLMYRQLLHTECKPGLRLSRAYQATNAQKAVVHMPWWEQGVEQTKRMVISYDNLIVRLWLSGAIMPYVEGGYAHDDGNGGVADGSNGNGPNVAGGGGAAAGGKGGGANGGVETVDLLSDGAGAATVAADDSGNGKGDANDTNDDPEKTHVDTLIDSNGLPPVPHPYWVDRLGFQQTDPVTDFRSGGVLSLAMLVHVVETCPAVHARFLPGPRGVATMLPFGITCINVTDMLAKFLMFSKSVDRIDALLSQKPFWRMFGDPNAILVCQELCMDMLCDVVVEMGRERLIPGKKVDPLEASFHGGGDGKVTVFDFAQILERTEKRVENDLLGSGPKSVPELRAIHARIKAKYERALEKKERAAERQNKGWVGGGPSATTSAGEDMKMQTAGNNAVAAGAGGLFGKLKGDHGAKAEQQQQSQEEGSAAPKAAAAEVVSSASDGEKGAAGSQTPSISTEAAGAAAAASSILNPAPLDQVQPTTAAQTARTEEEPDFLAELLSSGPDIEEDDGGWMGSGSDAGEFVIDDDDDEDIFA